MIIRALLRRPCLTGIICAGTKGAMADAISQLFLQQRGLATSNSPWDVKQTLAFGLWNASYCGGCVYLMYSLMLPRVWPVTLPSGTRHPRFIGHVLRLVAFDNLFATPLLCFPTYYLVLGGLEARWQDLQQPVALASAAMRRYKSEFCEVMTLSWTCVLSRSYCAHP